MTQEQILEFLGKNKGDRFTAKDIAESLSKSKGSVNTCLKSLRKSLFVKFKKTVLPPIEVYEYWVN